MSTQKGSFFVTTEKNEWCEKKKRLSKSKMFQEFQKFCQKYFQFTFIVSLQLVHLWGCCVPAVVVVVVVVAVGEVLGQVLINVFFPSALTLGQDKLAC
jgi:hypothetical protein